MAMASALCWAKMPVYYKIAFTLLELPASETQRELDELKKTHSLCDQRTLAEKGAAQELNRTIHKRLKCVCVCVCATSIYTYVRTCVFVSPSADLTGDRA